MIRGITGSQWVQALFAPRAKLSLPRTKVPGNISFPGAKVPGNFRSILGAKVPTGNFRSEERKYRGAKSPDTVTVHISCCFDFMLDNTQYSLAQ